MHQEVAETRVFGRPALAPLLGGLLLFAALAFLASDRYLVFHSLVELFGVTVGLTVFVIAWNARSYLDNTYLLVLAVALLFISIVDTLHTLSYKGMGVFAGYDTDLATQLWLCARYLQAAALVAAPLLLGRRVRTATLFAVFGTVAALLVWSAFARVFPPAFVEGQGLTPFKIGSEYVISLVLLVAIALLWSRRDYFEPVVARQLALSIAFVIASEMSFTLYADPYGFFNVLGHLLKIGAVYLVYRAMVRTALERPFALLFRELKQNERVLRESEDRQRQIADTLQEALLVVPESIPGLSFGHLYRSATLATRVGGDFYDLFELDEHRVGILLGDVSGKGLQAATMTSMIKNTVRAYAHQHSSPAGVMRRTNDLMAWGSDPGSFVTAFFALLDRRDGALVYCSAGHPPAIIRRGSSTALLECFSPALGAFPDLEYREARETLALGEVLVLYTDGVTEARSDEDFYGEDRLLALVTQIDRVPVTELPRAIYEYVAAFAGGTFSDDIALLALARVPSEPQSEGRVRGTPSS